MSIISEIEAALPALHRYARSLVSHRQDADDLVQECIARALGRLPQGDGEAGEMSVRPWLFTILHNLGVSRLRSLRRWGQTVAVEDAGLSVPAAQEWGVATRDLLRGFERLSADHRQVLLLVSVEGLEYHEVATILGVPVGTVMSRLSRARDALRTHMNGDERPVLRRIK
jgi:RNA polymerase sigma-70 factor (ECF subfamily)